MAKKLKPNQESYEGWVIEWADDGSPSAHATIRTGKDRVEKITYRTGRDADKRQVRRELTELIDRANDRMRTPHWQDWRTLQQAEFDAARKEGRSPLRVAYEAPPEVGDGRNG